MTKLARRFFLNLAAGAAALCTASSATWAQTYPTRPITMIVPFPAGGGTDIIARIISAAFQKSLGQSVVVDNRPGGGGNPGMAIAARATPDGYTLLMAASVMANRTGAAERLAAKPAFLGPPTHRRRMS